MIEYDCQQRALTSSHDATVTRRVTADHGIHHSSTVSGILAKCFSHLIQPHTVASAALLVLALLLLLLLCRAALITSTTSAAAAQSTAAAESYEKASCCYKRWRCCWHCRHVGEGREALL
eukprot:19282-Heterococcus_DN1.PRE.1